MTTFATADSHFGHANVIQFSDRPFRDVKDMERQLISNWNEVVGERDDVYHLGDFTLSNKPELWLRVLCQLNGQIHLILGNHDNENVALKMKQDYGLLSTVSHYRRIKYQGHRFILLHYAMRVWQGSHSGAFHLYAHSHGNLCPAIPRSMDVGVDCNDYRPVSLDACIEVLDKQQHEPLDHHGAGK